MTAGLEGMVCEYRNVIVGRDLAVAGLNIADILAVT